MSENKIYKISPSSLNLYLDCQLCFWLQLNEGLKRPEPPMSSLPNGIDLTLKNYFDYWRQKGGVPPLLQGRLTGRLVADQAVVAKFRSRSFQWFDQTANAYLTGILDDALELADNSIVPLDNKTRGFPPVEPHAAHIRQMSAYSLLLRENGFKTSKLAYLIYWFFNHKSFDLEKPLDFNVAVEEVKTDPDYALNVFREAAAMLRQPRPLPTAECQFCAYRKLG